MDPSIMDTQNLVNISMSIEVATPCHLLSVSSFDVVGFRQTNFSYLTLRRISRNGTFLGNVKGANTTDNSTICGNCYGLTKNPDACCNSCDYLTLLSLRMGIEPTPELWDQCAVPANITVDEKCFVKGKISVNRVPGAFSIIADSRQTIQDFENYLRSQTEPIIVDMTHFISRLRFGPHIPRTSTPYNDILFKKHGMSFKHSLLATPVLHIRNNKVIANGFEYTTMTQLIDTRDPIRRYRGEKPAITISYSFSPYTVTVKGETPSFIQVFNSFLGMIAGAYAIFSFFNERMQRKALEAMEKNSNHKNPSTSTQTIDSAPVPETPDAK